MRICRITSICLIALVISSCSGTPQLKTYYRQHHVIDASIPIAVVPAKIGGTNNLMLPDAIATELLGMGYNVVERTTVSQMVDKRGLDFSTILNNEEYMRLGQITKTRTIVIVNSTMKGQAVANATARVIDTTTGKILWSGTYTQPQPHNPMYVADDTLIDTARKIADSIGELFSEKQ